MKVDIEEIRMVVRLQLGLQKVGDDDRLVRDLGAVSADIVNIVVALEDKYGIELEESSLAEITTVTDLCRLVDSRL